MMSSTRPEIDRHTPPAIPAMPTPEGSTPGAASQPRAWQARRPASDDGFGIERQQPAARGQRRAWSLLLAFLVVLDAICIWLSLSLAYSLRISSGILAYEAPYDPGAYRTLALLSVPIWLALFAMAGLYRKDNLLGGPGEYQQVVKACTSGVIALMVLSFVWREFAVFSRGWLLLSWFLSCALVVLERFLARRLGFYLRRRGWLKARVLIAGANDQGVAIAEQWHQSPTSGMEVLGFLDDFKPAGARVFNGLRVVGRPSDLDTIARRLQVDEVVVVATAVAWETFEQIVSQGGAGSRRTPQRAPAGYTIRLSPGFYEVLATGVAVTSKSFVPLFTVNENRLVGVDAMLKTALDYGIGSLLLIAASPLMALIAAGLKLAKPEAPVLARFQTVGRGSRVFAMVKFRAPLHASGLERWLFRSGLDKLPQLFNLIGGQMSLVGPRPRVIGDEATDLRTVRNLQTVKPGLTGPWAVPGTWTLPDEEQAELYYVRNWTIWLDTQILVQTVLAWLSPAGLHRDASGHQKDCTAC